MYLQELVDLLPDAILITQGIKFKVKVRKNKSKCGGHTHLNIVGLKLSHFPLKISAHSSRDTQFTNCIIYDTVCRKGLK